MSYNNQEFGIVDFMLLVKQTWKLLLSVIFVGIFAALAGWFAMNDSYEGQASLKVSLTEDLYKQASAIFHNPVSARDYLERHGATSDAIAVIPTKLEKLSTWITPVYAYNYDRSLESTKPQDTTNTIIQLKILLNGDNISAIKETINLLDDFIRNAILTYQANQYVNSGLEQYSAQIPEILNEMLELRAREVLQKKRLEELQNRSKLSPLPENYTWTLPEKDIAFAFLPPQVRLTGVQNTLQTIEEEKIQLHRRLARKNELLSVFTKLSADGPISEVEEFLTSFSKHIDDLKTRSDDENVQFVINRLLKDSSDFKRKYKNIYFLSAPEVPNRPANLKIRVVITAAMFGSICLFGFLVIFLLRAYSNALNKQD